MNFPSIRLEGSILSADLLDAVAREDKHSQRPSDFGFDPTHKVKDEIATVWATSKALWTSYQAKIERLCDDASGTTETRNLFILPLLSLLSYQPEKSEAEHFNGKSYAISHRDSSRDSLPLHIVGWNDSLDKKRAQGGPRMSPHGLVQEYLNLTEHLYAIVSNGRQLRILRDSSRLIKLSFLEFDLIRIFEEELFADFALLFRLLHATRLPNSKDDSAESIIERYHQDSLDSGSRVREQLAKAVEVSIKKLANGFLSHPANEELRQAAKEDRFPTTPSERENSFSKPFYQALLRLIYRLLFLLVTEERGLIQPCKTDQRKIQLYRDFYSLSRIRKLSDSLQYRNSRYTDAWQAMLRCFELFAPGGKGVALDIAPLGGLFDPNIIGLLNRSTLDNKVLLEALNELSLFTHPGTKVRMRINYAALNVEEFGSVYEGLLEYDPSVIELEPGKWQFRFVEGDSRSSSGSHYTPDELVQPLIKHSLDYLIKDKLKEPNPERALLSLTVCDIACGSGHILLNAARRIATELAIVRTGEEQPSPQAMREATRDVIKSCIYGVDLNPLAVELCKVALWLEAHVPGEPLGFLDHHIKCGNAIVGFVSPADLEKGVPDEAFKTLSRDDKEVAGSLRKRNKAERKQDKQQTALNLAPGVEQQLEKILKRWKGLDALPEKSPEEIAEKKSQFQAFTQSDDAWLMQQIAAIPIAQFYLPKTHANKSSLITDEEFQAYRKGERHPAGQATAAAWAVANRKRFFHWFLEFPHIMRNGGFDCILGNPPFLGGTKIPVNYGKSFLNIIHHYFAPAKGRCDLVAFFFRRAFELLKNGGFQALISTNTLPQGDTRSGGIEKIIECGGSLNFAIKSIPWPGLAAVQVSLASVYKGSWVGPLFLNKKPTNVITSYLDDSEDLGNPERLLANKGLSFEGTKVYGKGFIVSKEEKEQLLQVSTNNKEVLSPFLTGDDLNSSPTQSPARYVIDFKDWDEDRAKTYIDPYGIILNRVKSDRLSKSKDVASAPWWQHWRRRESLYHSVRKNNGALVINRHTKIIAFCTQPTGITFSDATVVVASSSPVFASILNSTFHEIWAWKYGSTMGSGTLRYTPVSVFETFPIPISTSEKTIAIGKDLLLSRLSVGASRNIGLTKLYNNLNDPDSEHDLIEVPNKERLSTDLSDLRSIKVHLDRSILEDYGWSDIDLRHDFYEVDYLPENDRIRYTIHPDTRKEILKRLLKLNHQRHAEEVAAGLHDKKKPTKKTATKKAKMSETIPFELPHKIDEYFLELPNTARTILSEEVWWTQFLAQFIALGDDFASLPNLEEAWQVMVQNKQFEPLINGHYGPNTDAWLKSLPKDVPNEGFIPYLVDLYDDGKRFKVEKGTWKLSMPDNSMLKDYQGDEWVRTDVKAAIGVLKSKAYKPILEESPLVSAFKVHLAAM